MKIKNTLLIIFSVIISFTSISQKGKKKANEETHEWRYEIESEGTGVQGTYQVKIWTYSKHPETAIEQAKKNAIHAIIFKGFADKGRTKGKKALARNPVTETEHAVFFKEFFNDGGMYQKFVFLVNNGAIAPGDRIKISKKEYKIGVVVSINVTALRKYLEEAQIIKALDSGF